MSGKHKSKRSGQAARPETLPLLNPNAAGMDIGAEEIYVAVPADRDGPVQRFGTFTGRVGPNKCGAGRASRQDEHSVLVDYHVFVNVKKLDARDLRTFRLPTTPKTSTSPQAGFGRYG